VGASTFRSSLYFGTNFPLKTSILGFTFIGYRELNTGPIHEIYEIAKMYIDKQATETQFKIFITWILQNN
jgi:hypothetical protein